MRFIIVTGMSGAGKSTALKMLEDAGYFCVDNLPVQLVPKLGELLIVPGTEINKIALGMDIRSGQGIDDLEQSLNELDKMKIKYEVLFLEASDEVLIKRYKETRRSHPLAGGGRVDEGIRMGAGKAGLLEKEGGLSGGHQPYAHPRAALGAAQDLCGEQRLQKYLYHCAVLWL